MENKEKKEMGIYKDLFVTFFKIGAFTFGGGYAMIPLIKEETVNHHHWISDEDILDVVAIAESTPGPIAINSATFIGSKLAGFWGAVCATIGVALPSFLIIYAISFILEKFENNVAVQFAFTGIRAAVLALILKALKGLFQSCPKGRMEFILIPCAFLAVVLFNVKVIYVIIACAVTGIICSYLRKENA